MLYEQTVEIPASRELHFDVKVPLSTPCGPARVTLDFRPVKETPEQESEQWVNPLAGLGKALGCTLTVEQALEWEHEERMLEEAIEEREREERAWWRGEAAR